MKSLYFGTLIIFILLIFTACQQKSDNQASTNLMEGEGIEVVDPWARPGAEGRMSAAYFLISNFKSEDDVLISVETDAAQNAEVHESYEREEGMMSMREVPQLDLPAQSTVRFEQGGLHVMLMQLNRQLSDGDTFELTLTFENNEPVTVEVPVRL
ncbi:copper chaperone PCu(A)C [Rhodohalobacter sp. 8-1]|uniref:copper chaperone PCu(A)C n=1 Tax=Rhodohalobacter sp. 8-1 TaxID=3131972 RepID=UPI0030EB24C0